MKNVAIIGGGASGLVAAYFAAAQGHQVTVFEKQKKIGRKILISGNGRCNLSNSSIDVSNYHGKNPKFVLNLFSRFGLSETLSFFESIGIPTVELHQGKIFPESLQSSTIVSILEYELARAGVTVKFHRKIEKIVPGKENITLMTAGKEKHTFKSVILAAGSCAYSPVGASGIGYELATSIGHHIIEPFPAILPINSGPKSLHTLEGIKWDCSLKVEVGNKTFRTSTGELLFTRYGLSGPVALDISRTVNEAVLNKKKPVLMLDLFPGYSSEELSKKLNRLWEDKQKTLEFSLTGILKNRMPRVFIQLSGLDPNKQVRNLSTDDRRKIVNILKGTRIEPGEARPFSEAVVAAGGVDVNEINASTMESRIAKNIFITGELLDIDGDSGGYNLQFAWSTGAIAGMSL